jgi:hypothetical protein
MKSFRHMLMASGLLFTLLSGAGCMSNESTASTARTHDDAWCTAHPKQCDNQDWCAKHADKCTGAGGN